MCLPRWCALSRSTAAAALTRVARRPTTRAARATRERLKQLVADEFQMGMKKLGGSAKSKGAKGDKADEAKQAAEAKLEER